MKTCLRIGFFVLFFPLILGCGFKGEEEKAARLTPAPFHVEGRWIKDAQGRVAIFRGINIANSVKRDPWVYWTGPAEWDYLTDWGMNLVRLLIIWEAIEPEKGKYSDWFFETRTDQQIAYAEERGIYVLLDMHQDMFGPAFGGDGAPAWASRTDFSFHYQNPWGINYLARAVGQSFDEFWTNRELQDHFIGAWLRAVRRYRGRGIVIGYDLYNEPFPGSIAPWDFGRKVLTPFQDHVAMAIRRLDPGRIIFYEPMIFHSSGMPCFMARPAVNNAALAPHFYDPVLGFVHNDPYDKDPSRIRAMMALRDQEAQALGPLPWLMGEFGVNEAQDYDLYLRDFYDALDAHMASGTLWEYGKGPGMGPLNADGSEKMPFVNEIVRPYPQRIAGEPVSFGFNQQTKVFSLTYKQVPGVTGPTEIFIPEKRHYPGGFVIVPSTWKMRTEWDGRILKIYLAPGMETFTIAVKPAP